MTEAERRKALARVKGTVELTTIGSFAVFLAALTLLIGALIQQLAPIIFATGFVLVLLLEFASSADALGRVRRGEIELRLAGSSLEAELAVQRRYTLTLRLLHRRRALLMGTSTVRLIHSNGVQTSEAVPSGQAPTGLEEAFIMQFMSDRPGYQCFLGADIRLTGWLGLIRSAAYLPHHQSLVFAPSEEERLRQGALTLASPPRRDGVVRSDRNGGFGLTRELREYRPGDPVRSIAWKQFARFGKPLVRELEREVGVRTMIGVDCSALASEGTSATAAERLFSSLEAELVAAAGEGNSVKVVGIWNTSGDQSRLIEVNVTGRQLKRLSRETAESLLSELMRPREVPAGLLVSRLAEILYRYERLDFRTRERREGEGTRSSFNEPGAIDEKLLVKWLARELTPTLGHSGESAPATRRDWIEMGWLHWGLSNDRHRGDAVGLDGLVALLQHVLAGRTRADRVVYLTSSFERVPLREIESWSLAEKARDVDIELVLVNSQSSETVDFDRPYEAVADWLISRSARAAREDLDELNITTRGRGT